MKHKITTWSGLIIGALGIILGVLVQVGSISIEQSEILQKLGPALVGLIIEAAAIVQGIISVFSAKDEINANNV